MFMAKLCSIAKSSKWVDSRTRCQGKSKVQAFSIQIRNKNLTTLESPLPLPQTQPAFHPSAQ
jgi:hypothetical protein